jgi:hypothetical protein
MPMTDAQAKAALRTWSLVTRIWSGGEYVYWLRAQPTDPGEPARAPRLTVPVECLKGVKTPLRHPGMDSGSARGVYVVALVSGR